MVKRAIDVLVAGGALVVLSPVLALVALVVWAQDRRSPLYVAPRAGLNGQQFRMVKFRTMIVGAARTGVTSTAADDPRITAIGALIRRTKLDELPQLWNVLRGDMSLIGPRPNVASEVVLYTAEERRILNVRPGITDLASIVFADEGDILRGQPDPDAAYRQLIRPRKSELALFYVDHRSVRMDARILALTVQAVASRPAALAGVARLLRAAGAPPSLCEASLRSEPLIPLPPPGSAELAC